MTKSIKRLYVSKTAKKLSVSKNIKELPVSQAAYKRFLEIIHSILSDSGSGASFVTALDRYLEGDKSFYRDNLPENCVLAFEILRFEIDRAIHRSAMARSRARKRATVKHSPQADKDGRACDSDSVDEAISPVMSGSGPVMSDPSMPVLASSDLEDSVGEAVARPLSRRERRRRERDLRQKMKFRKL